MKSKKKWLTTVVLIVVAGISLSIFLIKLNPKFLDVDDSHGIMFYQFPYESDPQIQFSEEQKKMLLDLASSIDVNTFNGKWGARGTFWGRFDIGEHTFLWRGNSLYYISDLFGYPVYCTIESDSLQSLRTLYLSELKKNKAFELSNADWKGVFEKWDPYLE